VYTYFTSGLLLFSINCSALYFKKKRYIKECNVCLCASPKVPQSLSMS
jgi:hypothetical protein